MARSWRIEFEGALYHVLSRGNEQRDIFPDDTDRFSFLRTLGEMSERFGVDIFAYILMNNHYHLLIRTNRANLSKSMQWLGATYTKRFNVRHARSGHLFQGRFKNIIVENNAYLIRLSLYIHRNPLRAGLVERLAEYRWSSYPAYAYDRRKPHWLNTELILSQFQVKDRHKAYRQKVQLYAGEERKLWEDFRHGIYLGSKMFADHIRSLYLHRQPAYEIPQQKRLLKDIDPLVILNNAAEVLNCDVSKFRKSRRISPSDKDNRDLLIYLIWETGALTNQEIGGYFDLSYAAVSKRAYIVKSRIREDQQLREKYHTVKSQIKIRT